MNMDMKDMSEGLKGDENSGLILAGDSKDEEARHNDYIVHHYGDTSDSDTESYNEEDWRTYTNSVNESNGFEVVLPPNLYILDPILPVSQSAILRRKDSYEGWAKFALQQYNKDEDKNMELVQVIKANAQMVSGVIYYLTFSVKDKDVVDLDNQHYFTCQAKVYIHIGGDKELLFFDISASPSSESGRTSPSEAGSC